MNIRILKAWRKKYLFIHDREERKIHVINIKTKQFVNAFYYSLFVQGMNNIEMPSWVYWSWIKRRTIIENKVRYYKLMKELKQNNK